VDGQKKKIISIIIFPGSNCDRDLMIAVEKNLGIKPYLIWHQTRNIKKTIKIQATLLHKLNTS